ncbi:MAG: hypothetical protein H7Y22_05085 [Gemmatimonadaceae bacterium]|nr:hypothetical protein [Gloeobacterales cyanobacterium ES-bin-141]
MKLLILLLVVGYAAGAWFFMKGAKRMYQDDQVWKLALIWPALFLTSSQFRRNFQRALKP